MESLYFAHCIANSIVGQVFDIEMEKRLAPLAAPFSVEHAKLSILCAINMFDLKPDVNSEIESDPEEPAMQQLDRAAKEYMKDPIHKVPIIVKDGSVIASRGSPSPSMRKTFTTLGIPKRSTSKSSFNSILHRSKSSFYPKQSPRNQTPAEPTFSPSAEHLDLPEMKALTRIKKLETL